MIEISTHKIRTPSFRLHNVELRRGGGSEARVTSDVGAGECARRLGLAVKVTYRLLAVSVLPAQPLVAQFFCVHGKIKVWFCNALKRFFTSD